MNPGQIVGFAWDVVVWFFLISVFALPISLAYWRARERDDAKKTKAVMASLLHDTTHAHEQDIV